ncbi:RagB/SusD family nutrient uptake outer membrane protein [Chitinophaga sp.]|uniref:RagB/SusD family nutrient uptake outer membrane protein n=1 Tax=Chitinophaga sp. TaxID=1869181 RepID=UPI00262F1139|nr:RagB/SusD family nutrient uptake outer membrane protein [uncultured Chitinophaga sp.]
MKRYILVFATAFSCCAMFSGCQKGFLDQVPDDRLTVEDIFKFRNTTENFLNNVYSAIPDEAAQRFVTTRNSGPWTGASDEADYNYSFVTSNNLNLGAWGATDGFVRSYWRNYYQAIRNASFFMANVEKCQELGPQLISQYRAEARALRAIYYFYLVRTYGPVVLLGDSPIPLDAPNDQLQLPRNTMDECVKYISDQLDAAANDLPLKPSSEGNYGRITRGIALAFKIEALMLNASPLFNGNTDYAALKNKNGVNLISQTYDPAKWALAATAAKNFINELVPSTYNLYRETVNGLPDAYLSCRNVVLTEWGASSNANQEWIFARPSADISMMQFERTPLHIGNINESTGGGALGATQQMVDAFFMDNGLPITDPASGYQLSGYSNFTAPGDVAARSTYNQWVNREPRFYVNITYDGSRWLNTNGGQIITGTQASGNSGRNASASDFSPTGYIVRKNMITGPWQTSNRSCVLLRLAQVYLNYAEALQESEPGHADVLKYLNLIRERAGIPQYGANPGQIPVPADLKAAIRQERRVELAFENVRYFDTRRWKIAETTDNGAFKGLNIVGNGADFLKVVTFETRSFAKRHYLFPIPQNEININKALVQNTGW